MPKHSTESNIIYVLQDVYMPTKDAKKVLEPYSFSFITVSIKNIYF